MKFPTLPDELIAARAARPSVRAADNDDPLTTNPEVFAFMCRIQGFTGVGEYGLFAMGVEMVRDGAIEASDPSDPWTEEDIRLIAHQAGLYEKDRTFNIVNIKGLDRPEAPKRVPKDPVVSNIRWRRA